MKNLYNVVVSDKKRNTFVCGRKIVALNLRELEKAFEGLEVFEILVDTDVEEVLEIDDFKKELLKYS